MLLIVVLMTVLLTASSFICQVDVMLRPTMPTSRHKSSKLDDVKLNTGVNAQQIALLEQDMRRIAESLGGNSNMPVERHPFPNSSIPSA